MKKRLTMYLTVGSDEKETYNVFNTWFRWKRDLQCI